MKKLLGILAISALAASAFAQGSVTLGNQTGLVKQWTDRATSTTISVPKNGGYVQLIAAPKGTVLANPLFTPAVGGVATEFSSLAGFLAANPGWVGAWGPNTGTTANPALIAAAAGIINGGTYTINNIGLGADADYIWLGWTGNFTSFDAALASANQLGSLTFMGASAIYTTATANPLATPPGTPVNLKTSFAGITLAPVVVIPEPTSFALAGLGLAALLVFRRRS